MAYYWSSSSATLPVLAPQPSHPSDSAAASAAGARPTVTRQLIHLVQGGAASMNQQNVPFSYENNIQLQLGLRLPEDYYCYIMKELTRSNVDCGQCRLLLPKSFGEHILRSMHRHDPDGLPIEVLDVDENRQFKLRLKQWSSTNSYVLIGNWIANFVTRKGLKKGDKVGLTYHGSKLYFKHFENHN